ncbi:MAG: hypothetical protein ACTHOU_08965 [Aureliella sp.]
MASQQIRSIDATEPIADETTTELVQSAPFTEASEVIEVDHRSTGGSGVLDATAWTSQSVDPSSGIGEVEDARSVELSEPFVARWSVLISRTNWEKGAIIAAWRSELEGQGAPSSAYSDEAWSRRVGGVTSQHVGRLRRVYQRFGNTYASYANLYWTHFLAALDWDDAEMWLEGASQSKWSVSEMRSTRWEATGGDPATQPTENEIVSASTDEDFSPLAEPVAKEKDDERESSRDIPEGPRYDEPDFGDEPGDNSGAVATADDEMPWEEGPSEPPTSPFASLPALPVDVADALEQFKLAIIRHRTAQWAELSQEDMLRTLDALKTFAMQ